MARCKLTAEIASKLEYYWQLGSEITLSDAEICARIGITYNQLRNWLQTDAKVTRENGDVEHISAIRERARAQTNISYLQHLHALLVKVVNANDYNMTLKVISYLQTKQFPKKYNRPAETPDDGANQTGVIEVPATAPDTETWSENKPKPQS